MKVIQWLGMSGMYHYNYDVVHFYKNVSWLNSKVNHWFPVLKFKVRGW